MIDIQPCTTAKQWQQFEDVAEYLHGKNAGFVPPFPGSVAKYLSPKSAFRRQHGDIYPFIARREGKVVGRIAAVVNRSHNRYYNDTVGFFGFFECENHPVTAGALFDKAAEVLKEKGFTVMRGPYNPSINDECGLMVKAHDKPPALGMTWNPFFYENLVNAHGFSHARTLLGLYLPMYRSGIPKRLQRIADRMAKRSKVTVRPIRIKDLEKELEIVHEVYNSTLERNWGFIPITMEDMLYAADDMRAIADPNIILIAECDGEKAGVAMTLPDFNQLLILTKKTPKWLRPLHVLWLMKTRRITSCRQMVYGISPRFRDKGIHGWLLLEQFTSARARYKDAEIGWVEENNTEIIENTRFLDGEDMHVWHIYERPLA